jgi:Zn-dependent membrane protease YugP
VEDAQAAYFGVIRAIDMSFFATLFFVGTVVLSLWASMRVRRVYGGAPGVAAHECGRVIQHKQAYAPPQWRMALVGLTTFASQIVLGLLLLGMFTGFINPGVALTLVATAWGILVLVNLITLPVEFDAFVRARRVLKQTTSKDGGRRGGGRKGIARSGLDLRCCVHHIA